LLIVMHECAGTWVTETLSQCLCGTTRKFTRNMELAFLAAFVFSTTIFNGLKTLGVRWVLTSLDFMLLCYVCTLFVKWQQYQKWRQV